MNRKTIAIITMIILVSLITGGTLFVVADHNNEENYYEQVKEHETRIAELKSIIKNSWDPSNSEYVRVSLTADQISANQQKLKDLSLAIRKSKPKEVVEDGLKTHEALLQQTQKLTKELSLLTSCYQTTQILNEGFDPDPIAGSTVSKDVHLKNTTSLEKLTQLTKNPTQLTPTIHKIINEFLSLGNQQMAEKNALAQQIGTISSNGEFKPDVTIDTLNKVVSFAENLKYPFLKEDHQELLAAIPGKIEELTPKLSKLSATERDRMILALWEKDMTWTTNTDTVTTTSEDGHYEAVIFNHTHFGPQEPRTTGCYQLKDNGDFEKIYVRRQTGVMRTGNVFQEITPEMLGNTRADPYNYFVPDISYETFKEKMMKDTLESARPEERPNLVFKDGALRPSDIPAVSDDYYVMSTAINQSGAATTTRFNRKTGMIEGGDGFNPDMTNGEWHHSSNASYDLLNGR